MSSIEFIFIATGLLLLIASVLLGRRQKARPEGLEQQPPQPVIPTNEDAEKLQKSLTELLRELHTLSNDMTVDLEEKLAELKEMLQQADNKLEEMSAATVENRPIDDAFPEPSAETNPLDVLLDDEPVKVGENNAAPVPTGRYREIYQMDDEGLPINEIARRMNMGKGEIQLILSLREKD
jgi:hypothetical protein